MDIVNEKARSCLGAAGVVVIAGDLMLRSSANAATTAVVIAYDITGGFQ
jgi:hypothetical protein